MAAQLTYTKRREVMRKYSDGANPHDLAKEYDIMTSTVTGWARFLGIADGGMLDDDELDRILEPWKARYPDPPPPPPPEEHLSLVHPIGDDRNKAVAASGEMETFRQGLIDHSEKSRASLTAGGTDAERAATLVKGITEMVLAQALADGLPQVEGVKDLKDLMTILLKVNGITNKAGRNTNAIDLAVLGGKKTPGKVIDV